jgi:phosphopantothenoylcysteine decarboxylase/phosphopantothenate--cysteine ligase
VSSNGPDGPDGTAGGRLAGRLIAVGVTGSIAAYKAADLVRRLRDEGADIVVLMTPTATRFVGELTFAALTRHPVESDVGGLLPDQRIGHIVIADSADAIVVAPATAHWLAAMATGLSGDAVTAACLATAAPVVVAPAMDGEMWQHPATRANAETLRGFGYTLVEPEEGALASGSMGRGRLAETGRIVDAVIAAVAGRPVREPDPGLRPPTAPELRGADLEGRSIVVSAGGTAEPIDPVRFIGNRSSGRMGVAIAEAALDRGAEVVLVAGTVNVPLPGRATVRRAETAAQMRTAVLDALPDADALIMAAAVADFRPATVADRKIKKADQLTQLVLEPTHDFLVDLGRDKAAGQVLVGFAAETDDLVDNAASKLRTKRLDLIVGNDISQPDAGFEVDTNRAVILDADGGIDTLPLLAKSDLAGVILDKVARLLEHKVEDKLEDKLEDKKAES